MSENDFLSRWSRRKRAAEEPAISPAPPVGEQAAPSAPDGKPPPEQEFDLSTLPPIESITSGTDVSGFLRKGVPLELKRAALRRAWASDPAIRDFVGLAENAWDFNDPTAMAGFGPLDHSPEQVREMVAQAFGEVRRVVDAVPSDDTASQPESDANNQQLSPVVGTTPAAVSAYSVEPTADRVADSESSETDDGSVQKQHTEMVRRTHGGALPR